MSQPSPWSCQWGGPDDPYGLRSNGSRPACGYACSCDDVVPPFTQPTGACKQPSLKVPNPCGPGSFYQGFPKGGRGAWLQTCPWPSCDTSRQCAGCIDPKPGTPQYNTCVASCLAQGVRYSSSYPQSWVACWNDCCSENYCGYYPFNPKYSAYIRSTERATGAAYSPTTGCLTKPGPSC